MSKFEVGQQVVDGCGREGRIIATDRRNGGYPIVALLDFGTPGGGEAVAAYTDDGRASSFGPSKYDIRPIPVRKVTYRNLYFDPSEVAADGVLGKPSYGSTGTIGYPFSSPQATTPARFGPDKSYACTLKITTEDGRIVSVELAGAVDE